MIGEKPVLRNDGPMMIKTGRVVRIEESIVINNKPAVRTDEPVVLINKTVMGKKERGQATLGTGYIIHYAKTSEVVFTLLPMNVLETELKKYFVSASYECR